MLQWICYAHDNSLIKALVVHIIILILYIAVMWCKVDKFTLKTRLFHYVKPKKKKKGDGVDANKTLPNGYINLFN